MAVLLIVGALLMGCRTPTQRAGAAPSPWLVALAAFVVGLGSPLLPPSPLGTDALLLSTARRPPRSGGSPAVPAGTARTPPRSRWGADRVRDRAFWTHPICTATDAEKLGHNIGLLVLVTLVGVLAVRRGEQSRGAR